MSRQQDCALTENRGKLRGGESERSLIPRAMYWTPSSGVASSRDEEGPVARRVGLGTVEALVGREQGQQEVWVRRVGGLNLHGSCKVGMVPGPD